MSKVRFAIIGAGNMGSAHVNNVRRCANTELVAVCDCRKDRADMWAAKGECRAFYNADDLFAANIADAVIVAVPHYTHPEMTIKGFQHGLHVLCEKPIGVSKSAGLSMVAEHEKHPELRFGIMFQQRTAELHKRLRSLIKNGEIGKLMRVNWTLTNWYRSQAYYNSGDWRATWAGEGGGVLLNQAPHHLDLFQWIFGMPEMVRSQMAFGKYHDIEVEDDVNTFCAFPGGYTGNFIASTGEFPGVNRLEVSGTRGRLILEDGVLKIRRLEEDMETYTPTTKRGFGGPQSYEAVIEPAPEGPDALSSHQKIIQNFVEAILDPKVELIARGEEGLCSVELGNAMLYSALTGTDVKLPMDTAVFDAELEALCRNSRYGQKVVVETKNVDMNKSF